MRRSTRVGFVVRPWMIVVMFAAIIVLLATVFFTGGKANAQGSAFWESFQDEQSRLDRNDWRRAQERERQAGVDLARRLHNGGGPMYGSPNYGFAPPPQYGGYGNYGYNFCGVGGATRTAANDWYTWDVNLSMLKQPDAVPMIGDSYCCGQKSTAATGTCFYQTTPRMNVHNYGINESFCDGHVKWLRTASVPPGSFWVRR